MRLRAFFRLNAAGQSLQSLTTPQDTRTAKNVTMHRFEETINGRAYRIEVSGVGSNQWRAQIARTPGGSAALMPFYGRTPDEAAQHLIRWLSIQRLNMPANS
jgi:hypothetical protein